MNDHGHSGERVARAELLMERRRYDEAERELRAALVDHPDDPIVHGLISACQVEQDRFDDAIQSAKTAIASAPDLDFGHAMLANALLQKEDYAPALAAIQEAIRLDPTEASHWATLSAIQIDQRQWTDGLQSAERGLEFDPEDVHCINLRAMALVGLGRKQEADEMVREALSHDPESAVSHANQGWTCLHRGEHEQALEHFSEALRLEPDLEWARSGLVQALRSKYVIYRWLLAYFLWSSRLSAKMSWGIVIICFVAFRYLRVALREYPSVRPILLPLVILVGLTFLLTWIGTPLFDTLLRFNRYGRYALNRQEKFASTCLMAVLLSAAAAGIAFWITRHEALMWAGIVLGVLSIPVSHSLQIDDEGSRRRFLLLTAGIALCGAMAVTGFAGGDVGVFAVLTGLGLLGLFVGLITYQILAVRAAVK